jgi:hypothetical protein
MDDLKSPLARTRICERLRPTRKLHDSDLTGRSPHQNPSLGKGRLFFPTHGPTRITPLPSNLQPRGPNDQLTVAHRFDCSCKAGRFVRDGSHVHTCGPTHPLMSQSALVFIVQGSNQGG